jgi:GTP-binding protein EngB required for normal cell division
MRRGWGPLVEGFLDRRRQCVAQAVLVVDARHGGIDSDLVMKDWLAGGGFAYLVAATKADKLRGGARASSLRALSDALGPDSSGAEPILVSSVTGAGVRDVWARLDAALARHAGIARGRAWTSRR